jgi:hypothetical protein
MKTIRIHGESDFMIGYKRLRRGSPALLIDPLRDRLPCFSQGLVQNTVARLVNGDQLPELFTVIHVCGVAELMNHHVAHEVRRKEEQLGVEREVSLSGETSLPGALALHK